MTGLYLQVPLLQAALQLHRWRRLAGRESATTQCLTATPPAMRAQSSPQVAVSEVCGVVHISPQ